ncbi:CMF_HP2_G0026570.mRNA.1.CDS.1 [Saccharomyces cerevisiae]|nr:CMF_HP2_G0026570.mRNA.1.CDS.1 [Saccharomyces cerevisiae]CAI6560891.1 CMF_HP2_G0026570.mRNA.1.CDS.1 [Saccharomyces cerevisiae]CAI6588053.1 CMF_HP1_G0029460.mRNA.1.CDS.1 [Saccharomyces cerevisiae]CAI7369823.1 CMF_collapsed_G0030850.mRNA.1.CDS.1 [Saccharomyces cerevisiae]
MLEGTVDYDPLEDITNILFSKESLNNIDELISITRSYKKQLQEDILKEENELKEHPKNSAEIEASLRKVFQDFKETQDVSASTELTISNLTEGISYLDIAKKNLTHSLTLFQNLKILTDSYIQCNELLSQGSFKKMVSPYKIMCSLAENTFISYKSLDEINYLLSSISRLKGDTLSKIKQNYNALFSGGNISEHDTALTMELREGACELLDCDTSTRAQMIDWCLDKLLFEMKEIFRVDDEAGSLENLSRRYIYFKKILNNFNSKFADYFLKDWEMAVRLTTTFYHITHKDLQTLLKREFKDKNPSIDLFMTALQSTLDFEKYIDVRFSKKIKEPKLSSCFEPYLTLWVSHQNQMMEKKFLSYMSEPKYPSNETESLVLPSSADLFRTYRSVLTQTLELIDNNANDSILTSLANFFSRWLQTYSQKILLPLLLPDNIEVQDKLEAAKYTVLLINTADYCATTIDQLEDKFSEFSGNREKLANSFTKTKNIYDDLLAKGTSFLLNRVIPLDLNFVWREFINNDWSNAAIEDYSRYMVTLKSVLKMPALTDASIKQQQEQPSTLAFILSQFNRDVYKWNFLDKVIDIITTNFVSNTIRLLQPVPPFSLAGSKRKFETRTVVNIGEQLLLDLELLKEIFHTLPESVSNDSDLRENTSYKRVKRHADNNIDQLLKFIKLLVAPLDSADDYYETYSKLTNNNPDSAVWSFVLALKGIPWDLALWKKLWSAYNLETDDTDEGSRPDSNRDLFIFKWDKVLLGQFENNLARMQDPNWSKFVRQDLKISPPVMKRIVSTPQIQQQKEEQKKQSLSVKDFVSHSRFFNRGT